MPTVIRQSANAIVMVRPCHFFPNPETARDNAFQREVTSGKSEDLSRKAQGEFDQSVKQLARAGIRVHVFEDTASPAKPDAVFPNNWFSTHEDGRVALYPMYSAARRAERRRDFIDSLRETYQVAEIVDYSRYEDEGIYLEGTGSLVLDYQNKIAYASISQRTHPDLLKTFCSDFGYEAVTFQSRSSDNRLIYHTNVMMCVGSEFALVGLEAIADGEERLRVQTQLENTGKQLIELSSEQISDFAGNAIELEGNEEKLLVLSTRAAIALSDDQRAMISNYARIVPLSLPTIELAGGSARCMIATVHLPCLAS